MEAALHQRLDSELAGGAAQRGDKSVPFKRDFRSGRQACYVDQALRVSDRLLVERCDPSRQRIDKCIEFRVRQGSIDVTVTLGEVAVNIVCAEQHFERTASADQSGQPSHRSAARHQGGTNLPLRQNGLLAARKTHVAGQRKLASDPGRTAADGDNGYDGSPAEAYQHVRKGLQARGSGRQAYRVLERREEVIVREEEAFDGAIEDNDLHMVIGFERHDDLVELRDRFGSENIERWMIERNSPIRWQAPFEPNLSGRSQFFEAIHARAPWLPGKATRAKRAPTSLGASMTEWLLFSS